MTLPSRRLSRPLARSTMSSAWSHGTLTRRRVTLPCTESDATTLRLDSSAINCSTVRTGTSWKLKVTGLPVKPRCPTALAAWVTLPAVTAPTAAGACRGLISTTYSLPLW